MNDTKYLSPSYDTGFIGPQTSECIISKILYFSALFQSVTSSFFHLHMTHKTLLYLLLIFQCHQPYPNLLISLNLNNLCVRISDAINAKYNLPVFQIRMTVVLPTYKADLFISVEYCASSYSGD